MAIHFTTKDIVGMHIKKEVHGLDKEKIVCQIEEMIDVSHAVNFDPDELEQSHREGFNNCLYCIKGSFR